MVSPNGISPREPAPPSKEARVSGPKRPEALERASDKVGEIATTSLSPREAKSKPKTISGVKREDITPTSSGKTFAGAISDFAKSIAKSFKNSFIGRIMSSWSTKPENHEKKVKSLINDFKIHCEGISVIIQDPDPKLFDDKERLKNFKEASEQAASDFIQKIEDKMQKLGESPQKSELENSYRNLKEEINAYHEMLEAKLKTLESVSQKGDLGIYAQEFNAMKKRVNDLETKMKQWQERQLGAPDPSEESLQEDLSNIRRVLSGFEKLKIVPMIKSLPEDFDIESSEILKSFIRVWEGWTVDISDLEKALEQKIEDQYEELGDNATWQRTTPSTAAGKPFKSQQKPDNLSEIDNLFNKCQEIINQLHNPNKSEVDATKLHEELGNLYSNIRSVAEAMKATDKLAIIKKIGEFKERNKDFYNSK